MKKLLAGLGLALAGAVVLQAMQKGRRRGGSEAAESGRVKEGREAARVAELRPKSEGQPNPAVVSAVPLEAAQRREPEAKPQPARSAEEVLNSATRQQLMSVYGIGPVLADRILHNRPYTAAYDVVEQGIIPESTFVQLRKQLLEQHSA